jgi:hypothetical protein
MIAEAGLALKTLLISDVNAGQKILLRLRPAWAQDTFYEEDHVVGTMLHEVSAKTFIIGPYTPCSSAL